MSIEKGRLDGLITFFASHHAIRAEKVLSKQGFRVLLVPGPREISPNCGVALQFSFAAAAQVQELLQRSKVQFEAIHQYQVEIEEAKLDDVGDRRNS